MHFRRLTREDISETTWRWRCKIERIVKRRDKTLADFSSGSSFLDESKDGDTPDKDKAEDGKDANFGATAAVKTLYERRNSSDSWIDWVDYPPKQLSKSAAKSQDRVAIKVYKVRDLDKPALSGRFTLKYFRIDIQNPQLVVSLEEILKKEDVHLDANEIATFREPFRPLYFCYDDIVAKYKCLLEGDTLKPHMLLLIKVLDDVFSEIRIKRKHLLASGLVSFKLAWTYFPKDCEVMSWGYNGEFLVRVVETATRWMSPPPGATCLVIRCKILRFNGEAFLWEDAELEIPQFEGNKPITDLPHYPLRFLKDADDTKRRLTARGKRVLDYQGLTYCMYSGIGIYREEKRAEKHNVEGRILIDVVGFNKHHLTQGAREGKNPDSRKNTVRGTGRPNPNQPADMKGKEKATVAKRLTEEERQKNKDAMLAKEQDLMFMVPLIEGYALKNKLWLSFYVEDIRPMVWNDCAFDHLVYDEQQKDLVLSFVENHNHAKPMMGDVIVGKGEGLIILLSGPPGTGKTLTAEAVADRTHRPLFYLQAEDLGINASMLGANVKRVFEMATEWNAIILLDEADVFMAERDPHDIARNELVSIFLRELEYFRGIVFLTTNLYSTIDSAFRSRVSLHLLFKPLTPEAREKVWRKFLDRLPRGTTSREIKEITEVEESTEDAVPAEPVAEETTADPSKVNGVSFDLDANAVGDTGEAKAGPSKINGVSFDLDANTVDDAAEQSNHELSDEDLQDLAAWHLNGREIKNAVKMVKSWCDYKGYELTLARLENGIRVTSPHASKHTHENDTSLYDN